MGCGKSQIKPETEEPTLVKQSKKQIDIAIGNDFNPMIDLQKQVNPSVGDSMRDIKTLQSKHDVIMRSKLVIEQVNKNISIHQRRNFEREKETSIMFGSPDEANSASIQIQREAIQQKQRQIRDGKRLISKLVFEAIQVIDKPVMSNEEEDMILNCIMAHPVLGNLNIEEMKQLLAELFYCSQNQNETIYRFGDHASHSYIISKGQVNLLQNDEIIQTVGRGKIFGDGFILNGIQTRSQTAVAQSDLLLWGIKKDTFRKFVEIIVNREFPNFESLKKLKVFENLQNEQLRQIIQFMVPVRFDPGSRIIKEGDDATTFYIIREGVVNVFTGGVQIRNLQAGQTFGEQALYEEGERKATIFSVKATKCITLSRNGLKEALGEDYVYLMFNNSVRWIVSKDEILQKLSPIQVEKMLYFDNFNNYEDQEILFKQGETCYQICIVLSGYLQKKDQVIAQQGEIYGLNQYFQSQSELVPYQHDVIMGVKGTLFELEFDELDSIIGNQTRDHNQLTSSQKLTKGVYHDLITNEERQMNTKDLSILKL